MRGADGLKTGHTADGGYGMVASAKVGGRRLIGVINGFNGKGHDALAAEMKKLMEYGYQNTVGKVFFDANEKITEIPVWYGVKPTVVATVAKPFAVTVDKQDGLKNIRILARYDEPIAAPVRVGDVVGELIAEQNGRVITRAPLVAKDRVRKIQFFGRVIKNIRVIFGI
jgi:D-alanyl-D-alanine carboxypeptidase (penicillin-binding protein 5/6)